MPASRELVLRTLEELWEDHPELFQTSDLVLARLDGR